MYAYPESIFTGIVQEVGRVQAFDGSRLRVAAPGAAADAAVGDSVAIAGVCLTVVEQSSGTLAFDAVPETLARTSLRQITVGDHVNVEPALRVGARLGGHIMQGHVDSLGRVRAVETEGEGKRAWFDAPPEVLRYCAEKGSIAVDGASLTIAALDDAGFAVALIPHTLSATTLGSLAPGNEANLEVDVLAKYVERLLGGLAVQR